jgi:hypothetical protein
MTDVKHALDYASGPPKRRLVTWILLAGVGGVFVSGALVALRRHAAARAELRQALIMRRTSGAAIQTAPATQPNVEWFFLLQPTNDLGPTVFTGPTTRPGTPAPP